MDFHRGLKIQPQMEELRLKRRVTVSPKGMIFTKPDGLIIVPGYLLKALGQFAFMRDIGLAGKLTGVAFQPCIAEWFVTATAFQLLLPRKYQRGQRQRTGAKPCYQGFH